MDRPESIPARIARIASITPDRVAVVSEKARMTYGELDRRSTLLAARLNEASAGPDQCVGLLLERSPDFVVAALAVMKSGAAYLPLDTSTPADRITTILDDAAAIVLLTDPSATRTISPGRCSVRAFAIPDGPSQRAFKPLEPDPKHLAYIIYTSGSTGTPKGVEITHANLCNLIDWHVTAFGVTSADRASQVARLEFDAAVWEIWPYLTTGASVHIADDVTRRSAEALREWIVAEKITIGYVPTAFSDEMIRAEWPAETSFRMMLTGGDALRHRPKPGLPFTVVNNYGPTECTVVATSGTVSPYGDLRRAPSIGRPVANAFALILDEALRPVAPGQAGELCIAGALVARGYRNRPGLTASRFVTYVTASGKAARIYRTGDRARLRDDGEIEFLGRSDDQVKIRGYRIEVGEVVASLNQFKGVEASVVAVRDIGESGPALVAFVVPTRGARLAASELREFLASKLPDYMLPTAFVSIPKLPVSANGKLDASALPQPSPENVLPYGSAGGEAAVESDGMQGQISALVASMLGRPSIGSKENFFMVGGHSMLGVELVAKIRDTFGVKLTLRQLFSSPTVAALAAQVALLTAAAK